MDLLQNTIVGLILLAAVGYLARRVWLLTVARKAAGCASGCSSCPSARMSQAKPGERKQLVGIGLEPDGQHQRPAH